MCRKGTKLSCMFFIGNILFLCAGGMLLALGISFNIEHHKIAIDFPSDFHLASLSAIVIGFVILVVAVLGMSGTILQNNNVLVTYGFALLILIITELAVLVAGYVVLSNQKNLQNLRDSVENHMHGDFIEHDDSTTMDDVQRQLSCCGVNGPQDYNGTTTPSSCCSFAYSENCEPFPVGCTQAALSYFMRSTDIVGEILIATVGLELIGMLVWSLVPKK